jgi:putative endonuclease
VILLNHIELGNIGENAASDYLRKAGYEILAQKYRCRFGEIDIIAKNKDFIVFVEVKTRSNKVYGMPAEAVTYYKQQKIINTALNYLNFTKKANAALRFDILEVLWSPQGMQYNHIMNAFGR